MKDGLYHYQVGMPISPAQKLIKLVYSEHAKHQMIDDRYGVIVPPVAVDLSKCKIIEMEVEDNQPIKLVVRTRYNNKLDLCIVVNTKDGFVRTVWFNQASDRHNSLDRSKYVRVHKEAA